MIALRLNQKIARRLDVHGRKISCSKSSFARDAVLRHIDDIEDEFLARYRLVKRGPRVKLETLEREFERRNTKRAKPKTKPRARKRPSKK